MVKARLRGGHECCGIYRLAGEMLMENKAQRLPLSVGGIKSISGARRSRPAE